MTITRCCALLAGIMLALPLAAQERGLQGPGAAERTAAVREQLRRSLAPAAIAVPRELNISGTQPADELHLRWELGYAGSSINQNANPSAGKLSVLKRVANASRMPRLRSIELGEGRLLAAAVDASGNLRGCAVIRDPRFLRAEEPGPDGVLHGQVLQPAGVEFLVPVPRGANVVAIRFFQSTGESGSLALEHVAAIAVPEQAR